MANWVRLASHTASAFSGGAGSPVVLRAINVGVAPAAGTTTTLTVWEGGASPANSQVRVFGKFDCTTAGRNWNFGDGGTRLATGMYVELVNTTASVAASDVVISFD